MRTETYRVAVVALHPIQYQAGIWRAMAHHPRIDLRVFYLDKVGVDGSIDPTMHARMDWDLPLLEGHEYEFVPNWSPARFTPIVHRINPAVLGRLRRGAFDAIVVHGHLTLSNWIVMLAAGLSGAKLVFRGEGSLRGVTRYDTFWVNFFKRPIQKFYLRHCDAIACSSTDNSAYFKSRGAPEDRLFPMPCAIDQNALETLRRAAAPRDEFRAQHGLPLDAPVVVSVTRFAQQKRPFDTIEAFARGSLGERKDVRLLLVGDGPMREAVEAFARECGVADRVRFLGFLNQSKMVEAVLASDLFVLPSERDPSPKALSESTYLGIPAIASDAVGTAFDFIEPGASGAIFPLGDIDALAREIYSALSDPQRLLEMGARSHEIARANDFEVGVASFVEKLDALLEAGS